jgi:hypothetical protein
MVSRLRWSQVLYHFHKAHQSPVSASYIQSKSSHFTSVTLYFNTVLPFKSRFHKWSLSFRFSDWKCIFISHSPHICYTFLPYHSPWFNWSNNPSIWWWVQIVKFHIMQFSPPSCYFFPLGLNFLHLCSSLSMKDQFPPPIQNIRWNYL